MYQKRNLVVGTAAAVASVLGAVAYAANPEPVTAEVEFVTPITINENNALQFGLLDAGLQGGETIIVPPSGLYTDAASRVLGGAQAAADLTVQATVGQSITISVGAVTPGTGYGLGSFQCEYDAGAATPCDGAGMTATSAASAPLRIGATLTGNGLSTPGIANGSFEVTIAYQ